MAREPVWKKVRIQREVKTKEMFESVVREFGTGGAHIPFTVDYKNRRVLIIPIER